MTPAQRFCCRMAENVEAWYGYQDVASDLRKLSPDLASMLMAELSGMEAPEAVQRCVGFLERRQYSTFRPFEKYDLN